MQDKIELFTKMAESDPDNELGHFSLGKAYLDSGRFPEATAPFLRTLELNPAYSKAYHLLGEAQAKAGQTDEALETLQRGFKVADERGDRMPRDAMSKLIVELGGPKPVPVLRKRATVQTAEADADFNCARCRKSAGRMAHRPFKGELGERIWSRVCQSCWEEWVQMGTKVVNELRLEFSDPKHQQVYDKHMSEFLQLE